MNYFIIEITSPANSLVTVWSNLNLYQNNNVIDKYTPNSKEIYGILSNDSPIGNVLILEFRVHKN